MKTRMLNPCARPMACFQQLRFRPEPFAHLNRITGRCQVQPICFTLAGGRLETGSMNDPHVGVTWHADEQANALSYRLLEADTKPKYRRNLVAKVGVPSPYVAPLVERAFAQHPALYNVIDAEDDTSSQQPDFIVRACGV